MSSNAGKTVRVILKGKCAAVRRPPLEPGSPSWDDILEMTWEEVEEQAQKRAPGFRTFRKLLTDRRFNK